MQIPGRKYDIGSGYRYGFNGKENDNEVKGLGNQQDYGMRIYDPRLGRFLSVDPLMKSYPWNSPYSFAEGDVLRSIDLDGQERKIVTLDLYINSITGKMSLNILSSTDVNNPYKLGTGVLYNFRVILTNPNTSASRESTIPYYEANPQDILNATLNRMTGFGSFKFWKSGIVVFGTGNSADATMGGNSDGNVEVQSIIDLRNEDTKTFFEVFDLMGEDNNLHVENSNETLERVIKEVNDADEEAKNQTGNLKSPTVGSHKLSNSSANSKPSVGAAAKKTIKLGPAPVFLREDDKRFYNKTDRKGTVQRSMQIDDSSTGKKPGKDKNTPDTFTIRQRKRI